jgi:hypothetical protein
MHKEIDREFPNDELTLYAAVDKMTLTGIHVRNLPTLQYRPNSTSNSSG